MGALALVQPGLALDPQPVPAMRRAYEASTLAAQGITYAAAVADPLMRQALTLHAKAMESGRSTKWVRR